MKFTDLKDQEIYYFDCQGGYIFRCADIKENKILAYSHIFGQSFSSWSEGQTWADESLMGPKTRLATPKERQKLIQKETKAGLTFKTPSYEIY